MARPKKNIVKLTDNEVKQLKGMLQKQIHARHLSTAAGFFWLWMKIIRLYGLMMNAWPCSVSAAQRFLIRLKPLRKAA